MTQAPPLPAAAVPTLEKLADVDAHEGPVYAPDEHALYFTTVPQWDGPGRPRTAIKRLDLGDRRISIVRHDANMANGMALAPDGRLVVCEQGTRCADAALTSVDRTSGETERLADSWRGLRLNSPNDVAVKSDGTLWFTDPAYGYLQRFRPEPQTGDHVYRYDPATGDLGVVAASFDKPNGLVFSPDERVLYVGDSGSPHRIKAFDVTDGRWLDRARVFAVIRPGYPDGLAVDGDGRVYSSSATGVQIFDPSGERIGEIPLPGAVNFTFGGPDGNVLYITADDAIWAAELDVTPPPKGA